MAQSNKLSGVLGYVDSMLLAGDIRNADSALTTLEQNGKALKQASKSQQLLAAYLRAKLYSRKGDAKNEGAILLKIADEAEQENLSYLACRIRLALAGTREYYQDWQLCRANLSKALQLIQQHGFDSLYGKYYLRLSSYYRVTGKADSALHFIRIGVPFAEKSGDAVVLSDTYLVLGMLLSRKKPQEAIAHYLSANTVYKQIKDYNNVANIYNNISGLYSNNQNIKKALLYNDSALLVAETQQLNLSEFYRPWLRRSKIFETLKQYDSAYYYYKKYSEASIEQMIVKDGIELKKITEQYESDKKEATIKSKNNWLFFSTTIAALITIALILLYLQNRKIKKQNKTINTQVTELSKLLSHKNILLAEVQHRVKNNLLQMQSLLDIQEESAGHNTLEEVIRENKNRIESMVLLQKKINNMESLSEVDGESYLCELARLVEESYRKSNQHITLHVSCSLGNISMNIAMPLGLIMVELISNSFKHAFKNRNTGNIYIVASDDSLTQKNKLAYRDDGIGFDFHNTVSKGLGFELIRGFTNQINGRIEATHNNSGSSLFIYF
ncbi:MAG TPA: sensor histidine kinase [Flavipsychrobacter sp.]|nr:sensor histidine kinase [Flavipsychrobacter sp.]